MIPRMSIPETLLSFLISLNFPRSPENKIQGSLSEVLIQILNNFKENMYTPKQKLITYSFLFQKASAYKIVRNSPTTASDQFPKDYLTSKISI